MVTTAALRPRSRKQPCPSQVTSISVSAPRSEAYFAASTTGAEETTSTRGSASRRCVTERAQEATTASAPFSGSPRNRKIPWGGTAPGRLGREDARNFGDGTLVSPLLHAFGRCDTDQIERRLQSVTRGATYLQSRAS